MATEPSTRPDDRKDVLFLRRSVALTDLRVG
jgi:hypothetical protein